MENSDVVKEEVRARIERFREIVEAIPKHKKVFDEIKTFLETSFPESVILARCCNEAEDIKGRIYRLREINKYLLEDSGRCDDAKLKELHKTMEEEEIGSASFLKESKCLLDGPNLSKMNFWTSFWYGKKIKVQWECLRVFFSRISVIVAGLQSKLEKIRKTITAKMEVIRKNRVGKELVIFEMFLKKEHLCKFIYSAEEFLLSLEFKERVESVSFGDKEIDLEEKKRSRSDKEKEKVNSFSAIGFAKLNEEERELDDEISSISDFITSTKTEILENEKRTLVSLEVMRMIDVGVFERIFKDIENIRSGLENLNSLYILGEHGVFVLCKDFIDRTFITDTFLLEKWLAMGKKAMVIRNNNNEVLLWKEWRDEEEKMIRWYFTKSLTGFSVNEMVLKDISKAQG